MFGRYSRAAPEVDRAEEEKKSQAEVNRELNKIWWDRTKKRCMYLLGNELDAREYEFYSPLHDNITADWNGTFVTFSYYNTKDSFPVSTSLRTDDFKKQCDEAFVHMQRIRLNDRRAQKRYVPLKSPKRNPNAPKTQLNRILDEMDF